jgi:aspartyl-tRNA(Asn)/glutamyl-tRNA(Gln) amidotransferase subunit C
MSLSRSDVAKVALLARLQLSEEEIDAMTRQLGKIVEYVDLLGEVDTDDVEPMAHAVEVTNVFRGDQVRQSLPRSEALANAARASDEAFFVPPVFAEM